MLAGHERETKKNIWVNRPTLNQNRVKIDLRQLQASEWIELFRKREMYVSYRRPRQILGYHDYNVRRYTCGVKRQGL